MRNAMICASVMLALFLGWPLAFGGKHKTIADAEVRSVFAAPAAAAERPKQNDTVQVSAAIEQMKPESCYHRYQREVKQCSDANSAACRLKQADHWDMCEATGFWPE